MIVVDVNDDGYGFPAKIANDPLLDLVLQKYLGPISENVEKKLIRAKARSGEAIELINNILRISKLKLLNITTTEDIDLQNI